MNETINRIKAEAERARNSQDESQGTSQEAARRRCEAAAPLFQAFGEIESQFVRIDVLKRIWPSDYQRRNDRARGLIAGVIGGERLPHGLRLHVPEGSRTFVVEENWDGSLTYVASRETEGARPHSIHFERPEPWLEAFYRTMAALLEL